MCMCFFFSLHAVLWFLSSIPIAILHFLHDSHHKSLLFLLSDIFSSPTVSMHVAVEFYPSPHCPSISHRRRQVQFPNVSERHKCEKCDLWTMYREGVSGHSSLNNYFSTTCDRPSCKLSASLCNQFCLAPIQTTPVFQNGWLQFCHPAICLFSVSCWGFVSLHSHKCYCWNKRKKRKMNIWNSSSCVAHLRAPVGVCRLVARLLLHNCIRWDSTPS